MSSLKEGFEFAEIKSLVQSEIPMPLRLGTLACSTLQSKSRVSIFRACSVLPTFITLMSQFDDNEENIQQPTENSLVNR